MGKMRHRSSLWETFLNLITSLRKSENTGTITLAIFIGLLRGFRAIWYRRLIQAFRDVTVAYNNAVLRRSIESRQWG
jgi:hypothetical protein